MTSRKPTVSPHSVIRSWGLFSYPHLTHVTNERQR
nr:MAG TPA: hypothetical protein [Caudoviricetes sp.]